MSSTTTSYTQDVDFAVLALQDADFAKILKSNGQVDFSNPESVLQLTKSLLKRDFGLRIELPPDRLCPPVPNRQNYVLWIQRLLDTTSNTYSDVCSPEREVLGIDIGTGASCIYPLLGCAQRPTWRFVGTDIDEKSLQYAQRNVQRNHLRDRIKLLLRKPDGPLLPLDQLGFETSDFTMCNPPFYSSKDEMLSSAASKQRPPFTACTGSETEMVTNGGEVAFISSMIEESVKLKVRVRWYTSMLGKHSSVAILVQKLKEREIGNFAVTEFVQGSKTRRWGIAWSFEDLRPSVDVARGASSLPKAVLPFPSEYIVVLNRKDNARIVGQRLNEILSELPMKWHWRENIFTGVGFCDKAVWSRSARRHAGKTTDDHGMNASDEDEEDMAFGFKLQLQAIDEAGGTSTVNIRWLKGHDSVIFESFCGMVKRKMQG